LTRDAGTPASYEKAPEYSNVHEATEYLFLSVIEEKSYVPLLQAVASRTPIMDLCQLILFDGFQRGKWNPDLMLMLVEPLIYTLMSLAEKADIEYRIDDEDDEDDEAPESILEEKAKNIADLARAKMQKTGSVPSGALPTEILQQIEDIKIPEGLLAKPQQTEEVMEEPMTEEPQQSLLNKGQ
jgi:hypothetical protein